MERAAHSEKEEEEEVEEEEEEVELLLLILLSGPAKAQLMSHRLFVESAAIGSRCRNKKSVDKANKGGI